MNQYCKYSYSRFVVCYYGMLKLISVALHLPVVIKVGFWMGFSSFYYLALSQVLLVMMPDYARLRKRIHACTHGRTDTQR